MIFSPEGQHKLLGQVGAAIFVADRQLSVYLFKFVVHLEGWLDFPAPSHVPRCIDPVPDPRLRSAVHHLNIRGLLNRKFYNDYAV